jgi:uncharacterized RDD family membrane protein YckC
LAVTEAETTGRRETGRLAALRVLALVLDGVPVGIVVGAASFALGTDVRSTTAALLSAVLMVAYTTLAQSLTGTTLGKRLLRLRVTGAGGAAPDLRGGLVRNIWLLSLAGGQWNALILGAILAITVVLGGGRGLHDRASATAVVRA